ncbi:MAG TPA: TonB-dependent receptor [Gemmatimonadaceae bacterium]|nr:TonB-dependent receptor [Gemmatimonadaceae bacterium]
MRHLLVGWRMAHALRTSGRVLTPLGLLAALAVLPASAEAQTSTGNLRGYVTGAGQAPLDGVTVIARNVANNQQRGTLTNASGFYYIGGLRPGTYEITARRIGLTPGTRTVDIPIGQTLDVNFTLTQTAVTLEAVTVSAAAPQERTRTSEVGTNISREQIENLPNFERNFLDIARLAPGITSQNVNSTDKKIAAAGQPAEAVNVFVDGATYKSDVLSGGVVGQDASKGNPFPQGAVQEFRVVTQNYKAEYQKAGSAIITATTRSGTNDFEAEAFAYNVNNQYVSPDAITAAQNGPRPQYKRWQAGASIGGPIQQDRLFYFGTYELNRRTEPANVIFGPDSSKVPASLLSTLRPFTGGFAQEFEEHLGFGKLTWTPSGRHTVDASVSIRADKDFRGFGGQTSYQARENLDIDVQTGVVNWKWAGDRWLNEAQATAQHFSWTPTWINGDLIGKRYNEVIRIGGKDTQQDFDQNRLSLRDDITRGGVQLLGDHVFKIGGNVDFLTYRAEKAFNLNPVFGFRADENYAVPYEASFGFGDPDVDADNTQFGVYVQDDWTIGRRLVLNLGLRWDGETNMLNSDYVTPAPLADSLRGPLNGDLFVNQPLPEGGTRQVRVIDELGGIDRYISTGDSRPMYKKAFQPRVGASYDLFGNQRTVLFGGYGVYYDRNYWNTLLDEQFRRQYGVYNVQFRSSEAECATTSSPATCTVWDERYFDPAQLRQLAGSIGLPEVFMVANDLKPPHTEQFSAGIRQTVGPTLITLSYNGVRGHNYMNFVRGAYAIGGNYAAVFVTDDRVKTWYDALQFQIEKPFVGDTRWGGAIAYTLGRAEEQGQSTDLFWGFDERYPTVADRPRLRAPGDQRHKIVANGVFRLPAGLIVSTIINLGSGITVNATDETLGTEPYQRRTYTFTPPSRPFLGIGHVFATQEVDLRVEKPLRLGNGQDLSLVADIFNLFNNANYGCFNTTIPVGGNPGPNYGTPGCAGLGWRLQLGARYNYQSRPILNGDDDR